MDHERDKIAYDIAFASCAEVVDWMDRPDIPRDTRNATGDRMQTDGQLAVVQMNDCSQPAPDYRPAATRCRCTESFWQRVLRREILSARSDLIRGNIYWKAYEGARSLASSDSKPQAAARRPTLRRRRTGPAVIQPSGLNSFVSFR